MDEFIKVEPKVDGSYTGYSFVDGPYKGRTAFSIQNNVDCVEVVTKKGLYETYVKVPGLSNLKLVVFDGFEVVGKNTIEVETSCGQTMTVDLKDIDKDQPISEVTIRGVKYTPE